MDQIELIKSLGDVRHENNNLKSQLVERDKEIGKLRALILRGDVEKLRECAIGIAQKGSGDD